MRSQLPVMACLISFFIGDPASQAAVRLPAVLSDRAVLQRDARVPIWGWADPRETVAVQIGEKTIEAQADQDGRWAVVWDAMPAGGPHEIVVRTAGEEKVVKDVMFGEVWLASGQSNMHWTFAPLHTVVNNEQELADANDPWVRQFTVTKMGADEPAPDAAGVWHTATRDELLADGELGDSAVAYFFARELRNKLNVPVGILNASVGGTSIKAWSPGGVHYNAMILPLAPYALQGAIWYQGEHNCQNLHAPIYADMQREMAADWKNKFKLDEFSFYFVQLAPFRYSNLNLAGVTAETLPEFWEVQVSALDIPNSGMIVTNDIAGDVNDIHPRNKQDVGRRLALWALAKDYGQKDLVFSGPLFREAIVEGNRIRVLFDHTGSGLTTRDGQPPSHLEIAGEDGKYHPASGTIEGAALYVQSDQVPHPVAVRFAWREDAVPNLMNQEGLPAGAFRTQKPIGQ